MMIDYKQILTDYKMLIDYKQMLTDYKSWLTTNVDWLTDWLQANRCWPLTDYKLIDWPLQTGHYKPTTLTDYNELADWLETNDWLLIWTCPTYITDQTNVDYSKLTDHKLIYDWLDDYRLTDWRLQIDWLTTNWPTDLTYWPTNRCWLTTPNLQMTDCCFHFKPALNLIFLILILILILPPSLPPFPPFLPNLEPNNPPVSTISAWQEPKMQALRLLDSFPLFLLFFPQGRKTRLGGPSVANPREVWQAI